MDVKDENDSDNSDDETVFSPYTNRPYIHNEAPVKSPTFWCGFCQVRLMNARCAVNHLTAQRHLAHVNGTAPMKRKLDGTVEESDAKKARTYATYCHACKLELSSSIVASQHFKGKRHLETITAKLSGHRGAHYGMGRGNDFGRGFGGQFVRPHNNFYEGPLNRPLNPHMHSTYNQQVTDSYNPREPVRYPNRGGRHFFPADFHDNTAPVRYPRRGGGHIFPTDFHTAPVRYPNPADFRKGRADAAFSAFYQS